MEPSTPFIRRPVATTLLTFGLAAAGAVAFFKLPVSPLPQVDFPTISVRATLPGASPQDAATTVLAQNPSQVEGIGEVVVSGSSLPAVRVDLIPQALYKYGIGLEDVRAALGSANAHSPKGGIDVGDKRYQIYANDQANKAD